MYGGKRETEIENCKGGERGRGGEATDMKMEGKRGKG